MKYILTIISLIFISCSSTPSTYVLKDDIYGDDFSEVKILNDKDIESLPEDVTFQKIIERFGTPWATELAIYTYPKKRNDINFDKDSDDIVWRNAYWFIPRDSEQSDKELTLAFVFSSKERLPSIEDSIFQQFDYMTIDWPKEFKGRKITDVVKKWKNH